MNIELLNCTELRSFGNQSILFLLIVVVVCSLGDASITEGEVSEAFQMADTILHQAAKGISDLINVQGVINLDLVTKLIVEIAVLAQLNL